MAALKPDYHMPQTPRGLARQGARLKIMCSSATCTHETSFSAHELIRKGYGDIHMSAIERRLFCARCKAVKPVVQIDLA
ncbi:hypothetical protein [Brevundimonas sp.]|uniref:hypothetical protein n=1 Tax=Brevundimonas sp. TaxID=1871086 RepID=UPI0025C291C2|nr:hypothetical protein [Brevundimonas sp.]